MTITQQKFNSLSLCLKQPTVGDVTI